MNDNIIAKTDRLILRRFKSSDLSDLYEENMMLMSAW